MEDLTRSLREHPFFEGVDETHIKAIVTCAKNVHFRPGEFLLREGAPATLFYLMRQGKVSLEVHTPGKETTRVETAHAGDVVGISWMFPPDRVHLDARALESVVAFALDGACIHKKMEADHDLGYALSKRLLALLYERLQRVRLQRLDIYKTS